jgi:putative transposase
MARKRRIVLPGVPQHVIQRGNNRQRCFYTEEDYRYYLECLQKASDKFDCVVHAYVLMTNHVHILASSNLEFGISEMMQSLGRRYVRYVNQQYQRTGTLWEGRYKSCLVQDEQYLLICYRYIELNPVRAMMVKMPGNYQWSSDHYNADGEENAIITPHGLYLELGETKDHRCENYRELFCNHINDKFLKKIRDAVNLEWLLGSERFKDKMEQVLQRRVRPAKPGRPKIE